MLDIVSVSPRVVSSRYNVTEWDETGDGDGGWDPVGKEVFS